MFEVISQITLAMLGVALLVAFIRLVKGPTLPDRIVAMDLIGVLVVGSSSYSRDRAACVRLSTRRS